MTKRVITTDRAPQAIGTYSQAVEVNGVVHRSKPMQFWCRGAE